MSFHEEPESSTSYGDDELDDSLSYYCSLILLQVCWWWMSLLVGIVLIEALYATGSLIWHLLIWLLSW